MICVTRSLRFLSSSPILMMMLLLYLFLFFILVGHPVLRAALAVEELGGGQDSRPHDGPGRWHLLRSGEETEEEAAARLPGRQPQTSQLVGLSLLFLRDTRPDQRCR